MEDEARDAVTAMDQSLIDESLMGILRQRSTGAVDELLAEELAGVCEQELEEEETSNMIPLATYHSSSAQVEDNSQVAMDQSLPDESLMGILRQRSTRALDELLAEELADSYEQELEEEETSDMIPLAPHHSSSAQVEDNSQVAEADTLVNGTGLEGSQTDKPVDGSNSGAEQRKLQQLEQRLEQFGQGKEEVDLPGETSKHNAHLRGWMALSSGDSEQPREVRLVAGFFARKRNPHVNDVAQIEGATGPGAFSINPFMPSTAELVETRSEDTNSEIARHGATDPSGAFTNLNEALDLGESSTPLSEALAVDDPEEARPYDNVEAAKRRKDKSDQERRSMVIAVAALVSLVAIITAVVMAVSQMGAQPDENTTPLPLPPQAPRISLERHVLSLLPEHTLISLEEDKDSPQSRAFEWILADPHVMAYSDERIVQRFALGSLYHATNGDKWRANTEWMSYDVHECYWHAQDTIKIINNIYKVADEAIPAIVTEMLTPYTNVSVPCEDPVTEKLYTHLWLPANELRGQIPPETYLLTSLKTIVFALNGNGLTGSALSTEIAKLSSLEVIAHIHNGLDGTIPTEIGMLSRLRTVVLTRNQMSGSIPTQIGLLSDSLRALTLKGNAFTGTIHESLGSLKEMRLLTLGHNELTGSIPTELGKLRELLVMGVRTNHLSGTIPTVLGRLQNLQTIYLDNNRLDGAIPSELGLLENLAQVYLESNLLTGSVPSQVANLVHSGSLDAFHIFDNELTGTLSDVLCRIETISGYNNQLSVGCNCTCSFELPSHPGLQLCSPLPNHCG